MDRRRFLAQGLGLTGAVLFGCRDRGGDRPAVGGAVTVRGFEDEGQAPMHALIGEGPEGRRFTDLSLLQPGDERVPPERFFVRTRAPVSLARRLTWSLRIEGARDPLDLPLDSLAGLARPQGIRVLECAGNDPGGRFGMLSAAEWTGIPWTDLLSRIRGATALPPSATRVLFRGADAAPDGSGDRSWIFPLQDLVAAFLATGMHGEPLPPDLGGPVRLLVPGWYGCACIKWVEAIAFLDEAAPATPHMREYAGRTHQAGIPELARDFRPARMGLSALPIRLERLAGLRADPGSTWRLSGLTWGGESAGADVEIQTGDMAWKDVEVLARRKDAFGWTHWTHAWRPPGPGIYRVTLRPKDPAARAPRLRSGYYARDIRIDAA